MRTKPLTDETTDYARDVVDGKIPACRWVRLACERHIRDQARDDIWFDPEAARRFFRYCSRYLRHYKGPYRGKPVKLEPWQKFVFGSIYGWKQTDDGEQTDRWRFNLAYIEVPRKNGKTTLCAAGASYDCSLLEDTGAEVYCVATKEDQAKLLYNDVVAYINGSPDLAEVFEVLQGKNTVYARESKRTSFIRPLGSDSTKQDGLNPLAVYADELHAWPDRGLWDVMEDAFGARDNWHMIAITTAGNNRDGICWEQRDHVIEILEQRVQADNKFGIIYTVDDDMRDNWMDPATWFIANPNLGTGKLLKYMENKAQGAKQMPASLNTFLNKQLNIWTDVAEAWLNTDQWNDCCSSFTAADLRGKRCVVGLDLARVNDLSAIAYVFPTQPGLEHVHVLVDFFLPKDELKAKSQRDRHNYPLLVKQGWLTATDGKTTNYTWLLKSIQDRSAVDGFRIVKITYDRHFSGELVEALGTEGFTLEEIGMGFLSLAAPTEELERLVVENQIRHNNNPILNWNIANTVIRRDPAGNKKPDKELSRKKIDGTVAVIMALGKVVGSGVKRSVYEKRGIVMLGK